MTKVSAVVGSSFGDESKGAITDYLSDAETLVIRYNGGAQAGHTVVDPDGRRHVFHHFGAGGFRGAGTFLSRFFIVNPLLFMQEYAELASKGIKPVVYVDPGCPVSTPYDMMLNQAAEKALGGARHGSCGLGINETVTRNELGIDFSLRFRDLVIFRRGPLETLLNKIRTVYVPRRAEQLGFPISAMPYLFDDGILERFIEDVQLTVSRTGMSPWSEAVKRFDRAVFEGAQGLRLDQDSPDFPYVTRSKTGLTNVLTLLQEAKITDLLNVYYVSRPYITRHGAGPLPHELAGHPYRNISDPTNIYNEYQGTLRFGLLDIEQLIEPIVKDLRSAEGFRVNPYLALTCLDQLDDEYITLYDGQIKMRAEHVRDKIIHMAGLHGSLAAHGPDRNCIYPVPTGSIRT